ncbi:hypothetical protein NL30_37010 [Burkholderia contaminans]|nr:hypothetical protein NL30_37010 [Burkholderia contaminans]
MIDLFPRTVIDSASRKKVEIDLTKSIIFLIRVDFVGLVMELDNFRLQHLGQILSNGPASIRN